MPAQIYITPGRIAVTSLQEEKAPNFPPAADFLIPSLLPELLREDTNPLSALGCISWHVQSHMCNKGMEGEPAGEQVTQEAELLWVVALPDRRSWLEA